MGKTGIFAICGILMEVPQQGEVKYGLSYSLKIRQTTSYTDQQGVKQVIYHEFPVFCRKEAAEAIQAMSGAGHLVGKPVCVKGAPTAKIREGKPPVVTLQADEFYDLGQPGPQQQQQQFVQQQQFTQPGAAPPPVQAPPPMAQQQNMQPPPQQQFVQQEPAQNMQPLSDADDIF